MLSAYVNNHLNDLRWHSDYFYFVRNRALRGRLGKEFWSARAVYKLLEGFQATGALKRAQVKLQVLQYASIYEAVLHYALFTVYRRHPEVKVLRQSTWRTKVSVRTELLGKISTTTKVPLNELRVVREEFIDGDITKIRFDDKVRVAASLRLVTPAAAKELNELFSARNSIHLHAEIKKGLAYQLDLSRRAFKGMKSFRAHLVQRLALDGKLPQAKSIVGEA
jgi:hypothetical protein